MCKAELDYHDEVQSDASGYWPSAWMDTHGLMRNYSVCVACGQVV